MERVRRAGVEDARAVAQLLEAFNREFDEPAPPVDELAARIVQLLEGGDTIVLIGGHRPDGVAVLRFRPAIWSSGLECYLAELYVRPELRGQGLGRALMEAAIREARDRGTDWMEIAVDEPDVVPRRLYESLGFTTNAFLYERDLRG
jgi:GNAT superfamily N-acetyltransferase